MPSVSYSRTPLLERTEIAIESAKAYPVPLTLFRTWDALATNLPATAATDDLGLVTGTLATDAPTIQAGDLMAVGATTRYARVQVPLPVEYNSGGSVSLRVKAGMKTTIADTSCTVDMQAYRIVRDGTVGADLVTTTAQSMNSLTHADISFVVTPTSLSAGEMLDVRVAITCTDAAGATAVIPVIDAFEALLDVRG